MSNQNQELIMAKGQKDVATTSKSTKRKDYASKRASDLESMLRDLKKLPLEDYREYLERTPFKFIFIAIIEGKVSLDNAIKFEEDLSKILSTYNNVAKAFNIGGFWKFISRVDVKVIFGVVDGRVYIKPQENTFNKTPFYNRCFQDREEKLKEKTNGKSREYKLTRHRILTKLREIEKTGDPDHIPEDFARLATLFVLAACLAPTSSQSLMWKFTEHVDNFSELCSLDWSQYILETLMTSIDQNEKKAYSGCLMLLPYWLCENFQIIQPIEGNPFARFLKWDLRLLHRAIQEKMILHENSLLFKSEKDTVEALLKLLEGSATQVNTVDGNQEAETSIAHHVTTALVPVIQRNTNPTLRLDAASGERAHVVPANAHTNSDAIIEDLKEKLRQSEVANGELKSDIEKSRAKVAELEDKLKTSEEANHRIKGELGKSDRRRHELESYVRGMVEEGQRRLKDGEEDRDQPADQQLASVSEVNRTNVRNTDSRELRANTGALGKRQQENENEQPSKRACQGNI